MERLTMVEEFDSDGAIWKIDNDGGYIVQVNKCGEDDLYHTDDLEEARAYFFPEEDEEEEFVTFQDNERLIDLIVRTDTCLGLTRLKAQMEEQGYYLDDQKVIRKK